MAPVALVVEEDSEQRELASALLEESALDVITCESGEAALAVMQRRNGVVLIFADVRLAGMIDGVDLARLVAHHWPATKVIVTGAPGDRTDGLPVDAAYMHKPWRAIDVLNAAQHVLPRGAAA
jgi:CheY-like chemotaxis protein